MRNFTLKTLLCVALLALSAGASTAQQVTYGYDNAGNRVSRTITLTRSAVVTDSIIKPQTEMLDGMEIKIYPNPTKGQLKVEIPVFSENTAGSILLYAIQGQLILKQAVLSSLTTLDISNQPTGTYVMKITIGNKITTWKIIKE